ncbi:MAG: cellulase family glycosylhydrolase [Deltaproteobacteria bacterium]|nr:cellulase family glycosylhydrolase [Deltaproteobacteria bacterium]
MRALPLLAGLLLLGAAGCKPEAGPEPGPPHLRVEAGTIYEGQSALYLRGLNFSGAAKSTPDHHLDFDEADLTRLHEGGVNSLRYLVFWNAVAPEAPDAFDAAYLAGVRERIERLEAAGLRVIVDLHQDLWGLPFNGHGAPEWACPAELKEGYTPVSPWWANYSARQVNACFDRFWLDGGLQDQLAAAWAAIAGEVCASPAVIGWDLLNEPWPGSEIANRTFDQEVLLPFYRRLAGAIDAACPGKLYFLEPSLGWELGLIDEFEPGGPGDLLEGRVVVAPHFYPTEVHEPDGAGYDGDAAALARRLDLTVQPFLEAGHAVWMGEWGGMTTQATFGSYVSDLGAELMSRGVGFAYWDYGAADGGFLFLDGAGERKAVFDGIYALPSPTRMPGPFRLTAEPAARAITVETTCVEGGVLEIRRPDPGCSCLADDLILGPLVAAQESGALPAAPYSLEAICSGEGSIQVACHCP